VILPDTCLEEALEVAKRIHLGIREMDLLNSENNHFKITCSLGVGFLNLKSESIENFIQRVSDYTRKAKENGRDQIFYDESVK
ncbi:MAG: diguanylate cyclase, partial [bacterium]|nr:diguanylate cyclase [bacterium]